MKELLPKFIFIVILLLALFGILNSPIALMLGFIFVLFFENPFKEYTQKGIHYLLKIAVVGLGFGMLIGETLQTGKEGFTLTFLSIALTLSVGFILARSLNIDKKLGHLITSGTSICGGSAIAAVSPVIKAEHKTISMALGTVFLLNSVALFIFPPIGKLLSLTQNEFGLWSAVAIHDTSSVVGAALSYGDEALKIATTVKLSRTLWIIPLSVLSMFYFKTKGEKIKIPWFILLFVIAIFINSYHLLPTLVTDGIVLTSKRLLVVTLFLVGSTLSVKDLVQAGFKPIIFATILWITISIFSLTYILY